MKIFVAHSSNFDFKNELYKPLRESVLNSSHEIILPNETGKEVITKEIIKNLDVFIAEVSYPSTGQGIELGWADIFKIPIICIFKEGSKTSRSLQYVTNNFIAYKNVEDMIIKLEEVLGDLSSTSF